jgi:hypothetical protein
MKTTPKKARQSPSRSHVYAGSVHIVCCVPFRVDVALVDVSCQRFFSERVLLGLRSEKGQPLALVRVTARAAPDGVWHRPVDAEPPCRPISGQVVHVQYGPRSGQPSRWARSSQAVPKWSISLAHRPRSWARTRAAVACPATVAVFRRLGSPPAQGRPPNAAAAPFRMPVTKSVPLPVATC